MKNDIKYLFILFILLIFSCNNSNEVNEKINREKKINALLVKANDDLIGDKTRMLYADSVFLFLKKVKYDSTTSNFYFKLANRYFNINRLEKYKKISLLINNNALVTKDTFAIAKSFNYLGDYYYQKYNVDSCYYNYFKAQKYSKYIKDNDLKVEINRNLGNILHHKNNYLESDIYITKALKLAKNSKNYRYIYDCYLVLGLSQLGLNNYQKAIDYFLLSEESLKDLEDDFFFTTLKAQVYINFCNTYLQIKDYKNLLIYAKKGLSIDGISSLDIKTYTYLKNYYGYAKLKLGDKSALNDFNETLKIGDSLQFIPIQNTSNLHLGEYYLYEKDTIKALKYLEKANTISKKNSLIDDELKALNLLSFAEPKKSTYLKRIILLKDSLLDVERKTREKFSRIAFETDEIIKEKDVIEIDKNNFSSQRWIIVILSLFFILLVFLYFYSRIQKNKNRELEYIKEQQKSNATIYELMLDEKKKIEEGKQIEKQRISKELHDGVMGKLTSIRLNLFVLSKRTDQETINKCLNHIKDIQDIEKEIRNIAHDLNKDIFADNIDFISIVKNLFSSIENHSSIEFKLKADENIDWESLESNKKMQIYRVLQESLLNIDKYARAKKVAISMKKANNKISISIEDDGQGFDVKKPKNGIGLKNMRERIESINGKFKIESKSNEGTKINLIIPL